MPAPSPPRGLATPQAATSAHQRIDALKQKALHRIFEERATVAKLESELAARDERLQAALALLEEYGIEHRPKF